jgi:hypothetical protein
VKDRARVSLLLLSIAVTGSAPSKLFFFPMLGADACVFWRKGYLKQQQLNPADFELVS